MTTPLLLSPSLLSADFARLGEETRRVLEAGADWIHFDVMDNHYVPNLTAGPLVCQAIRPHARRPDGSRAPIDVHLMVEPVDALIEAFAAAGADHISFHPEASRHIDRSLQAIRDLGCKAGLALNPATPLTCLEHVLDRLDLVLVMSVNPGFGGQRFIPQTLPKLRRLRALLDHHAQSGGQPVRIEVDGGVKLDNIAAIAAAGADTFVAGSAVFGSPDADGGYRRVIGALRKALDGTAAVRAA